MSYRPITDADIDEYVTYIAKLAAITAPGDPPPARFRTRFLWTHGVLPQETQVGQHPATLRAGSTLHRGGDLPDHALAG